MSFRSVNLNHTFMPSRPPLSHSLTTEALLDEEYIRPIKQKNDDHDNDTININNCDKKEEERSKRNSQNRPVPPTKMKHPEDGYLVLLNAFFRHHSDDYKFKIDYPFVSFDSFGEPFQQELERIGISKTQMKLAVFDVYKSHFKADFEFWKSFEEHAARIAFNIFWRVNTDSCLCCPPRKNPIEQETFTVLARIFRFMTERNLREGMDLPDTVMMDGRFLCDDITSQQREDKVEELLKIEESTYSVIEREETWCAGWLYDT